MIKLLPLALGVVLAGTCAHAAITYVQVIGQSNDFTGSLNYTQRLENGITPVSDQKEITTSVVHAAFGSSAVYGLLKANTEIDALAFGGVLYGTSPGAAVSAEYRDWITVGGAAPVTLHFTMPTTGFFDPNSQYASVSSSLNATAYDSSGTTNLGIEAYCAYQAHVQTGNYFLDASTLSSDITVLPGTRISVSGQLDLNPTFLKSAADFSHTSLSYIDVLTPGGSIVADSGHDYSSAAVPEPTSLAFLGVAAILLSRRRTNR